jgi:hypothetical protein
MNSLHKEKTAQAALVDSLFFIAIISALGTGLFYFAINYGLSSEALLNSFYSKDFATDALKVLTYVNITRDGQMVTSNRPVQSTDEFDYLFAMIKEDYAEHNKDPSGVMITLQTQKYIARTLYSVLKPFDSSFDYIFFITKEGEVQEKQKFLVLIFALHKLELDSDGAVIGATREYYSCYPRFSNVIERYIYPTAGSLDSAIGRISLCETAGECLSYMLGIHIWVSKRAEVFSNITNDIDTDFVCTRMTDIIS